MTLTSKQHRRGGNFNNLDITNVKSLQINQDASAPGEVVRKSQAETIAQAAAEGNLINTTASASETTAFSSQTMVSLLATKQDNMSIHSSSTAFLEIINGTEVKVKQLLSQSVTVDTTSPSLLAWLDANPGHTMEEGDMLILQGALVNQERSWIHNGGSAGTVADFTTLVTDYNESVIRGMFSAGDTFLIYDPATGKYTVNFGTTSTSIGAQTIPVDNAEFTTVTGSTVLTILKALETYISQVDSNATGGSATIDTRLTSLSGVSGNNLGNFNNNLFPDNGTIKQILEASLTEHLNATADRAAIRASNATDKASLQSSIDNEVQRASGAELAESNARAAADTTLQNAINANSSLLISESQTRAQADGLIHQRLDIIEGDNQTVGSVSNAVATSNAFTVQQLAIESAARQAADAALDLKIDNLAQGDITFVGIINANNTLSIRQDRIDAGDTRNGQLFGSVALKAGETFVIGADTDIAYPDAAGGLTTYEKGDKLMLTQDVTAGSLLEANVNAVPANETGLSIDNVTASPTIELSINNRLDVKDDSISRDHLVQSVEDDIDDKRSLTQDNTITSNSDTHFVTDATTGAAQNVFYKRTSNTSDALTGTKRAILGEMHVSSAGSGNPASPNYAHTATYATHYNGSSNDLSIAVGGANGEAVVNNPLAAVYATGQYSLAVSNQLGINAGVTGVAQNAGISNIGVTGFGKAGGSGKDRGGVFAISNDTFENYAAFRSQFPISHPDAALIADAGTSLSSKAFVAVGESVFEGEVHVEPASADTNPVRLGDIKAKEYSETFDLNANSSITINHSLGTKKIIISIWHQDELVTETFDVDERTTNSFKIHNGSAISLTDVEVNILALSV